MNWLKKLPGYQRTPYGFELRLLRMMPRVLLLGTLLPLLLSGLARLFYTEGSTAEVARHIEVFDFAMIGLAVLLLTAVLTISIGCVIVWLMKGPAYVADGYDVSHSDKPKRD
ncbi:hypothetical protein [Rhodoferax sp.]|uniref:hypothetical protein n=1 Tax=Rhodoferax sp. TaxID=50421 RepID=UPI00262A2B50|nr:hypothetical protein [Rhodoferax sp.]MDD2917931.1 hypothetical protein [Rhodoferax sp.]